MIRTVAFIQGSPRSGSTLVAAILGSHSTAFTIGEAGKFLDHRRADAAKGVPPCRCCDGPCPVWDNALPRGVLPSDPAPWRLLRRLAPSGRSLYDAAFRATGATVLVDSSKDPRWVREQRARHRQWRRVRPALVFVTRDGRSTLASFIRKYPERSLEDHVDRWAYYMDQSEALYRDFPARDRVRVAYEDVARDPAAAARAICERLGMDYEPGMEAFWRHEHHIVRGNHGPIQMIRAHRHGESAGSDGPLLSERRGSFYDGLGFAIRADDRWRDELTEAQLAAFEARAGARNAPYRRDEPRASA